MLRGNMANDNPTTPKPPDKDPKVWDKPRRFVIAMIPTYKKPPKSNLNQVLYGVACTVHGVRRPLWCATGYASATTLAPFTCALRIPAFIRCKMLVVPLHAL